MVPQADLFCSVLKPLMMSFPGRVVCAIDSFLSLFGLCQIIHLTSPEFKPRKVRWIDSNFIGIVTIFSYDADTRVRFFSGPRGGIRFDLACWYADKFPWTVPIIIRYWFGGLRSHEV